MHVIRIEGKNFMRLKAVDVTLENGVVEITGKNRQGKSTLLKMIEGLGGAKAMPKEPLTKGESKGEFKVYLGDDTPQFVAKWTFNDKGNSYLTLESAEGGKCGDPATVLKNLISSMIDPWTFYNLAIGSEADSKKAVEIIKSLMVCEFDAAAFVAEMGYDEIPVIRTMVTTHKDNPFEFLKAFEKEVTEERKVRNSHVKMLESSLALLERSVPLADRDVEIVSANDLIAERDKINQVKALHDKAGMSCQSLEEEVSAAKLRYEELQKKLEERRQEASKLPQVDMARLEQITFEIDNLEVQNDIARKAQNIKDQEAILDDKKAKAALYDSDVDKIRDKRIEVMNEAVMPVDNMTIEDGKIMLNGIPFEQASSAEALGASIDVAVALKPKLKTLVCHNASLLDDESKEVIRAKAEEHGFQMLLEVVKNEAEPGLIYIEDGIATNAKE